MYRSLMHTGGPERRSLSWRAWAATITVVAVLIVLVALGILSQETRSSLKAQELEALRANVPARETVYPGSIPLPPTLVVTSPAAGEVSGLEAPFRTLAVNTALRSGPGIEYAIVRDLFAGEQVRALTRPIEIQGQQWQQVKTGEGQVGWCKVNELKSVSASE